MSMFSGTVITTEGFGIFNSREKQALIRRLGRDGVILLTDPDAGGKQIRSFISGILPPDKIYQVYVPRIAGKERRKARHSREGMLGVEGVGGEVLHGALDRFVDGEGGVCRTEISTALMLSLGLTGTDRAAEMRDAVCKKLDLPGGMNAKAFRTAVGIIIGEDELADLVGQISEEK
jgi:ribonuclease M5